MNLGKISADTAGGSITIRGANWSNGAGGVLEATGGGALNLADTFASPSLAGMRNTGGTINLTGFVG